MPSKSAPNSDAVASAKEAGLRYVTDRRPGIRRERRSAGFQYFGGKGGVSRNKAEIAGIKKHAVPPAWTDVWICPDPRGHIQATGRDAKRRKQYRYHSEWRAGRDENKYDRMLAFADALPKIRQRI